MREIDHLLWQRLWQSNYYKEQEGQTGEGFDIKEEMFRQYIYCSEGRRCEHDEELGKLETVISWLLHSCEKQNSTYSLCDGNATGKCEIFSRYEGRSVSLRCRWQDGCVVCARTIAALCEEGSVQAPLIKKYQSFTRLINVMVKMIVVIFILYFN